MLKRVYVDNYLCFQNFRCSFRPLQLLMGANGSGKSSLANLLLSLKHLIIHQQDLSQLFNRDQLSVPTHPSKSKHHFQIEVLLDGSAFTYDLVLAYQGDARFPYVEMESLHHSNKLIYQCAGGKVSAFSVDGPGKELPFFGGSRSALGLLPNFYSDPLIERFLAWLDKFYVFRLNPFSMTAQMEEQTHPLPDLTNVSGWYRHLLQTFPERNETLLTGLRSSIESFNYLRTNPVGDRTRELVAVFKQEDLAAVSIPFHKLSDGQRCLVCLNLLIAFLLPDQPTIVLDEPDNFLSLREIQPLILRLKDAVEENDGQALIVSHHPEILNELSDDAIYLTRTGANPTEVRPFPSGYKGILTPAEIVARGWEHE